MDDYRQSLLTNRVGQGFGVYGIPASYKSGVRYIYAEIWVLSISFVLFTTNFGCKRILRSFQFWVYWGKFGYFGYFFSGILVYHYPPPPPADPEQSTRRISLRSPTKFQWMRTKVAYSNKGHQLEIKIVTVRLNIKLLYMNTIMKNSAEVTRPCSYRCLVAFLFCFVFSVLRFFRFLVATMFSFSFYGKKLLWQVHDQWKRCERDMRSHAPCIS